MTNLQVVEIKENDSIAINAILIGLHDHYYANSGDVLCFTDNKGQIVRGFLPNWTTEPEDRGLISLIAVTSNEGAMETIFSFAELCREYVQASTAFKDFQKGNFVSTENGSYWLNDTKFEDTKYYRFVHNRTNEKTLARKKTEFEKEQVEQNKKALESLKSLKTEKAKWFNDNAIPVRVAYLFLNQF